MKAHPAIVGAVGGAWDGGVAGSVVFTVLSRWGYLQLPEAGGHSLTQVLLARGATETATAESQTLFVESRKKLTSKEAGPLNP